MENLAKKIRDAAIVIGITAATALPFTMQEFYTKIKQSFPTAQKTDSLSTPQYEYKKDGNYVLMDSCIMIDKDASNGMVFDRAYLSFVSPAKAIQQDSAAYPSSMYFQAVDTSKNLDSTARVITNELKNIADLSSVIERAIPNSKISELSSASGSYDLLGRIASQKAASKGVYLTKGTTGDYARKQLVR